jgi:hypothetical protein
MTSGKNPFPVKPWQTGIEKQDLRGWNETVIWTFFPKLGVAYHVAKGVSELMVEQLQ